MREKWSALRSPSFLKNKVAGESSCNWLSAFFR
jgi:hypothetical protein